MGYEISALPASDGGWNLRIIPKGWGLIGPRYLKGEFKFPAPYKNLSEDELKPAMEAWQKFMDEQEKRLKPKRGNRK